MDLLTVAEAAGILRVSPITVRRYIASGRLHCVRLGRLVRVDRSQVEEMVKGNDETLWGRPTSEDDPLWRIIGIGESKDGVTDVSTNMHKYIAEALLSEFHTDEEVKQMMEEIDQRNPT